jgi:NADPH2:quinone reductase
LLQAFGCWREFVVARAEMVIRVPDEVSDEDAAQALINPVTAWAMTMAEHQMESGDWIVQTAAGSTVGRLVLQLARSEGFKTINIVRRRAQVPEIRALGADVVLTSEDDNWGSELMRAADGKAPAKAIDCVSGRTGATVVRHLAPGGKLLLFGALSSHRQTDSAAFEMPIFGPRLIYGATTVQGWFLFHWLDNTPVEECRRVLSTILDRLACRELRLPPAKQHLPEKIADALLDADGTGRGGKPLLSLQAFGSG